MNERYRILGYWSTGDLERAVNSYMAQGFVPCGGMTQDDRGEYFQAVMLPPVTVIENKGRPAGLGPM